MIRRLVPLLLLLSAPCFADCTVEDVLNQIRPGSQYTLYNHDPATLIWSSTDSVKPTIAEINAGLLDCPNQQNVGQRNSAVNELLNGTTDRDKLNRAILLAILDQMNVIRSKLVPPLPAITIPQAKQAVQDKLNTGAAD